MTLEVIALDGDDTLWHSERVFVDAQARFRALLEPYVDEPDPGALDTRLLEVERRNLPIFGYGVKGFLLSLVETAIEVTDGAVRGDDIQAVLDLGKSMMDHPVDLLDGVVDTVEALAGRYRLMIITKGDLIHQETKVARSGLADRMWAIEIVSEKDEATYRRVLERHRIDPASFLMVGNSVRSDVLPVLEVGGRAAHVPYELTWELERAADDLAALGVPVLASLRELPDLVARLG